MALETFVRGQSLMGVGCTLLILTFLIVLVYPPASAIVVPLFTLVWIIYYVNRRSS